MLIIGALISVTGGLGYALPAIIGLESLGVPSPGETSLVLAGVLASQGKLNIVIVIAIAAASAIVGDNIGYLLGRKLGREVLTAPGPMRNRRVKAIDFGDRFFTDHGPKAVFIGRWIALVRFATAWLAGINHMPFRVFFPWNALGGITWAATYGLIAYYGGNAVINVLEKVGVYAAVALGVAAVAIFIAFKVRERRAGSAINDDGAAEPETGSRQQAPPSAQAVAGSGPATSTDHDDERAVTPSRNPGPES